MSSGWINILLEFIFHIINCSKFHTLLFIFILLASCYTPPDYRCALGLDAFKGVSATDPEARSEPTKLQLSAGHSINDHDDRILSLMWLLFSLQAKREELNARNRTKIRRDLVSQRKFYQEQKRCLRLNYQKSRSSMQHCTFPSRGYVNLTYCTKRKSSAKNRKLKKGQKKSLKNFKEKRTAENLSRQY